MRIGDEENFLEGLCTQGPYSAWAGQANKIGVASEMGWSGAAGGERTCPSYLSLPPWMQEQYLAPVDTKVPGEPHVTVLRGNWGSPFCIPASVCLLGLTLAAFGKGNSFLRGHKA